LQHHIHEAVERGYVVRLVNAQGLQFDLDIEEDWQAFQEQESSRPINNSTVRQFSP
jgi:2-phospho-L-lactate guanylyltransferase (CobY/MobA/RfbA family)